MRNARRAVRAVTLIEVAVLIGILALLLGIATPGYIRYRAHQSVNTAAETVEGLLIRSREEAKASGYALPSAMVASGLASPAVAGRVGSDGSVVVRLRKRYRGGQPAQTVTSRDLSISGPIEVEVVGLGKVDLETDTALEGTFFEIAVQRGAVAEIVAAIPIEVNGEFVFEGSKGNAAIQLSSGSYTRTLTLSHRGVVTPDKR